MKCTYILYLSIVLLQIGCMTKNNNVKVYDIQTKSMDISQLLVPEAIVATKDFLIVRNDSKDTIFYIYNLPQLTLAYSFGQKGKAYNEFMMTKISRKDLKSNDFFISDAGKKESTSIRLDSLGTANISNKKSINYPVSNEYSYNGKNLFCVNNKTPKANYVEVIDTSDNKIQLQFDLKESKEDALEELVLTFARDNIFCAYTFTDKIKIINTTTEEITSVKLSDSDYNKSDAKYFYIDADSDEDYFYALYIGATENNLDNAKSSIHIFDLGGNMIREVKLDCLISMFCIGPNKICYGFSPYDFGKIIEFKLPS